MFRLGAMALAPGMVVGGMAASLYGLVGFAGFLAVAALGVPVVAVGLIRRSRRMTAIGAAMMSAGAAAFAGYGLVLGFGATLTVATPLIGGVAAASVLLGAALTGYVAAEKYNNRLNRPEEAKDWGRTFVMNAGTTLAGTCLGTTLSFSLSYADACGAFRSSAEQKNARSTVAGIPEPEPFPDKHSSYILADSAPPKRGKHSREQNRKPAL